MVIYFYNKSKKGRLKLDKENEVVNVTASELEEQIFDKEGVRIVIRAGKDTRFKPYDYERKASATMSKNNW